MYSCNVYTIISKLRTNILRTESKQKRTKLLTRWVVVRLCEKQNDEITIESIRGSPLTICTVEEIIDDDNVIISIKGILEYLVGVASFVDRDLLEPGVSVFVTNTVWTLRFYDVVNVCRWNRAGKHKQFGGRNASGEGTCWNLCWYRWIGWTNHGNQSMHHFWNSNSRKLWSFHLLILNYTMK